MILTGYPPRVGNCGKGVSGPLLRTRLPGRPFAKKAKRFKSFARKFTNGPLRRVRKDLSKTNWLWKRVFEGLSRFLQSLGLLEANKIVPGMDSQQIAFKSRWN